jgi:colanic acid/amylovoran biosynthesis protein
MNTPPRRVLITNCVVLNGGDAAILYGLLDRLRAALGATVEFVIVDDQPEQARTRYPELDTRPRLDSTFRAPPQIRVIGRIVTELQRARVLAAAWCMGRGLARLPRVWLSTSQYSALETVRRCDAVVSTGGTYLVERYPIQGRLLELEVALAMRRPLVLFTQSLGPFVRRRHRRSLRTNLPRARHVLLRDERSRRHLTDAGLSGGRVRVVADGAFALRARPVTGRPQWLRVAISVRDWPYAAGDSATINDAYRRAIAALTDRLVRERGAEVTFLSTCQGAPGYWTDDAAVAAAIIERVNPDVRESVHVDAGFHRPQELLDALGAFDLVVATRMHMAILALVAGVPVFPIAYEFKTRELFDRLGLGEWVRDFHALDGPLLCDDVERFLDQLPALRGPLRARVDGERESALSTANQLAQALDANGTAQDAPSVLTRWRLVARRRSLPFAAREGSESDRHIAAR